MTKISTWLENQWYSRSIRLTWPLLPLSWVFGLLICIRRALYYLRIFQSFRLPIPVIIVGNITVGGTGKTPLVIWLAEQLQQIGYFPGVVSRGYGVSSKAVQPVDASSDPSIVGDEPVLIARRTHLPVFVGRDRVAAAQALIGAYPTCNVIISDDGLQHIRLQRDYEIVVIDGARGLGNAHLLPAGPLRESAKRLNKVHRVVANGHLTSPLKQTACLMTLRPGEITNILRPDWTVVPQYFAKKSLSAIAGIGNPNRFFYQLTQLGLEFKRQIFADHYPYSIRDMEAIQADEIIMTEKDAVKCQEFALPHYWYLPVSASLDKALLDELVQVISQFKPYQGKRHGY